MSPERNMGLYGKRWRVRVLARILLSCPGVLVLGEARMASRRTIVSMPVLNYRRIILRGPDNLYREMGEVPPFLSGSRVVRFCRELADNKDIVAAHKGLMDRAVINAWFYGGLVFTAEAPGEPYVVHISYLPLTYTYYLVIGDAAIARYPVESMDAWLQLAAGLEQGDLEAVKEACIAMKTCIAGNGRVELETAPGPRLVISWGEKRGVEEAGGVVKKRLIPENTGLRHVVVLDA